MHARFWRALKPMNSNITGVGADIRGSTLGKNLGVD
jgi:hypothetical protein